MPVPTQIEGHMLVIEFVFFEKYYYCCSFIVILHFLFSGFPHPVRVIFYLWRGFKL